MALNWLSRLLSKSARNCLARAKVKAGRAGAAMFSPRIDILEDRFAPATIRWNTDLSGNWSDASKWTEDGSGANRVPNQVSDIVYIDRAGASVQVTVDGTYSIFDIASSANSNETLSVPSGRTLTANSISQIGSLSISGGTVNLAAASDSSSLTISSGTLQGSGALTSGTFTWTGGNLSGSSKTIVTGTATLKGGDKYLNSRTLELLGTSTWSEGGWFQIQNNGTILNRGTFEVQSSGRVWQNLGSGGAFNNEATLRKSARTDEAGIYVAFNNTGLVEGQIGVLALRNGGLSTGSFVATVNGTVNGTINFVGGTHTLNPTSSLSGLGVIGFTGGTTTVLGNVNMAGTLQIAGGTANFNTAATATVLDVSSGTLATTAGTSTFTATTLIWTGGAMSGAGSTTRVTGVATLKGGDKYLNSRTLELLGTSTWSEGGWFQIQNNGTILNRGTFEVQSSGRVWQNLGSGGAFNNEATLRKSARTDEAGIYVAFNNTGLVEGQIGILGLRGGGTSTGSFAATATGTVNFAGGTHTLNPSSSLSGVSVIGFTGGTTTISGNVNVAGTIQIAGGTANFNAAATATVLDISNGMLATTSGTNTFTATTLTWTGGAMSGPGSTTKVTGTATLKGGDKYLNSRTLELLGTSTWSEDGWFQFQNNGTILNRGMFEVQSRGRVWQNSGTGGAFNNEATLRKSARTDEAGIYVAFNNTGLVEGQIGILGLRGGGTNNGQMVSKPDGKVLVNSLVISQFLSSSWSGSGEIALQSVGNAATPQTIEARSKDRFLSPGGFYQNRALGKLSLSGAYVKLIDAIDHASDGATADAIYVNDLYVDGGSNIDLNGIKLYYHNKSVVGNPTFLNGSPQKVEAATGDALERNVPASGNITSTVPPLDDWTFYGRAGETVAVVVNPGSSVLPASLAPYLNFADVQVVRTDTGIPVATAFGTTSGQVVRLENILLPANTTYRVTVKATAAQPASTGNYVVTVYGAAASSYQLVYNQTATGTVVNAQSAARWEFYGVAGDQLSFDLLAATPNASFTLTGPAGAVFTAVRQDVGTFNLPASGPYVLTVNNDNASPASYSFKLLKSTVTTLTLGVPWTGALGGTGDARLFRVDVPAGKQLRFALSDSIAANRNELYAQIGSTPSRRDFQFSSTVASSNQSILIPTAAQGGWYVLVFPAGAAASSTVSLLAEASTLLLTSVFPNRHGTAANLMATIDGGGFTSAAMSVRLVAAGGQTYSAQMVDVQSNGRLTATFTAGSVPVGTYSMRVSAPSGLQAELPSSVTIVAGGVAVLRTNLVLPENLGRQNAATLQVEYRNDGDIAMIAPVLSVKASDGALLTMDPDLLPAGVWSSASPDGFSDFVQFVGSGKTAGYLQPGERGVTTIHYAGLSRPWNTADTDVEFILGSIEANDAGPIDWNAMKSALRPASIDSSAWDAVYANLIANVGSTKGAYVRTLAENAQYLGGLGHKVIDVGSLWEFEVRQAIGLHAVATLGDAIDFTVAAPGMAVTLQRAFNPSLEARFDLGPLGRGWRHNWQWSLGVEQDGTVEIVEPSGHRRRFQPDSRSGRGYINAVGDFAKLDRLGASDFQLKEVDGSILRFINGALAYLEDARGNRITATYTSGRLTKLAHSSSPTTQYLNITYDGFGRLATVQDAIGRSATYGYDPSGEHLKTVTTRDSATAAPRVYAYDYEDGFILVKRHGLKLLTDPAGVSVVITYDAGGRISTIGRSGGAETTTYLYDSAGGLTIQDAMGRQTRVFFDEQMGLGKFVDSSGGFVSVGPGCCADTTTLTDNVGQTWQYERDARNRVVARRNPLGFVERFEYGAFDKLTATIDAMGNRTQYTYDAEGNVSSIVGPDGTVERYQFDGLGNSFTWTNRRGHAVIYAKDSSGRLISRTFADGSQTTYHYDARGNLDSATNASGTTKLTYYPGTDSVYRVNSPDGRFVEYGYVNGRRSYMRDQTGFTIKYLYDAAGRLEYLNDAADGLLVRYYYSAAGEVMRKSFGNGSYTLVDPDTYGRTQSIRHFDAIGALIAKSFYTYDSLGRIYSTETTLGTWTFLYDAAGQLTDANFVSANLALVANRSLKYVYDGNGNRTSVFENGLERTYLINSRNQAYSVGGDTYQFDNDGNLISRTVAGATTTFAYDDEGVLRSIGAPSGATQFQLDPFGRVSTIVENGVATSFANDLTNPYGSFGEYGPGGLTGHSVFGREFEGTVTANGAKLSYGHSLQGNTVVGFDAAGISRGVAEFDPFGVQLYVAAGMSMMPGFQGAWSNRILINLGILTPYRLYLPELGRFAADDPLRSSAGMLNSVLYAENDPINGIDPSGLIGEMACKIAKEIANKFTRKVLGRVPGNLSDSYGIRGNSNKGIMAVLNPSRDNPLRPIIVIGVGAIAGGFLGILAGISLGLPSLAIAVIHGGVTGGLSAGIGTAVSDIVDDACKSYFEDPDVSGSERDRGSSRIPAARDPNQKIADLGFGQSRFIANGNSIAYWIDFENDAAATAPAQRVVVTDRLDASLDWDSLTFTGYGFGDYFATMGADTRQFFTSVSFDLNGKSIVVEIELSFLASTGELVAFFQSIDPLTGLPPDVLTGFLPPEDGSGRGMGYFAFSIRPKASLPTGTRIKNIAYITFDGLETIATNQIDPHNPAAGTDPEREAYNTIDVGGPTSAVAGLPATTTTSQFTVSWSGQDDAGGSGIDFYDVYVSDNNGPYTVWQSRTKNTSALYLGVNGHTYRFYSVATDGVGHVQPTPGAAQATTTLNVSANDPPINQIQGSLLAALQGNTARWGGWLSVSDANGVASTFKVTLNVTQGSLNVATNVAGGVSAAQIAGNNTGTVVLTASLAAINATFAALLGVNYTPVAGTNGNVTLTFTSNDQFTGNPISDVDQVVFPVYANVEEMTEGNIAYWSTLEDYGSSTVAVNAALVRQGAQSLLFVTDSGGMAGPMFKPNAGAHWDLRDKTHLVFWEYGINTTPGGWQENQPKITIYTTSGSYTLTRNAWDWPLQTWVRYDVPLMGDSIWVKSPSGTFVLDDVLGIAIQHDTWDNSFSVYFDGVGFVRKTGSFANQAPTFVAGLTLGLDDLTVNPTTNPGNTVAQILTSGGSTAIQDADGVALRGIAVTAVNNTNGIWQYSLDGGSNWSNLTGVATTSARLLAADALTRIRFVPNSGFAGTVDPGITFLAWDRTFGTAGLTADVSTRGGGTAYSQATQTAKISVIAPNAAPVNQISGTLMASLQGTLAYWGGWLSVSDSDAGTSTIRVTLSVTAGLLHISTTASGGVTSAQVTGNDTSTVILNATLVQINATFGTDAGIFFNPGAATGSATLTMTTNDLAPSGALTDVDQVTFPIYANTQEYSIAALASLWSAFRDTGTASVSSSNVRSRQGGDAIRLDASNARGSGPMFQPLAGAHWDLRDQTHLIFWEYAIQSGTYVWVGNQPIVTIITATGNYIFERQSSGIPGQTWLLHEVPLAGDSTWIRSQTGSPTLADVLGFSIKHDAGLVSYTVYFDGAAFVRKSGSFTNLAPTFANGVTFQFDNVVNLSSNPGTTVPQILASSGTTPILDTNGNALPGIAVTALNTSNGSWQYSLDAGANWFNFGTVSTAAARLLVANAATKIRFIPNSGFNGVVDPGITFVAWDRTWGTAGLTADVSIRGGSTAFSSATKTAKISVLTNVAPVNSIQSTLFAAFRNTTANWGGWIDVTDADAGTGNFQLQVQVSSGTLGYDVTVAGGVSSSQVTGANTSLLTFTAPLSAIQNTLRSARGIFYSPAAGFTGNVTFTITANDLFAGNPLSDTDSFAFPVYDATENLTDNLTTGSYPWTVAYQTNEPNPSGTLAWVFGGNAQRHGGTMLALATNAAFQQTTRVNSPGIGRWDIRDKTHLVFWERPQNANVFQGFQPIVKLISATGTITLTRQQVPASGQWILQEAPLAASNLDWIRDVFGTPDLSNITSIEILHDTIGSGFTIWIDGMAFVRKSGVTANVAPTFANVNSFSLGTRYSAGSSVGILIADLIDSGGSGAITDVNGVAMRGIAVVATSIASGTWSYSLDNGANWQSLDAVTTANARLLAADSTSRVRFNPNAGVVGTMDPGITFVAWDRTFGTAGLTTDVSVRGGTSAFSTVTRSARIRVMASNATAIGNTLARDPATGNWWDVSAASGDASKLLGNWSTSGSWVDILTGDFNGDGQDDIAGRDALTGKWQVSIISENVFSTNFWATWTVDQNPPAVALHWADVRTGDFNKDGLADIAGRWLETGQWWVNVSTGTGFVPQYWGSWTGTNSGPGVTWVDVQTGDFNGDGRADIVSRWRETGQWWIASAIGTRFDNVYFGSWAAPYFGVTWVDVRVADLNADGRSDIVGRYLETGEWWSALSLGSSSNNKKFATWENAALGYNWDNVRVGDFNGDGKADIVARHVESGNLWVGLSDGLSFARSVWGQYETWLGWTDIAAADFNGDGRTDLRARRSDGRLRTDYSTSVSFGTTGILGDSFAISWSQFITARYR